MFYFFTNVWDNIILYLSRMRKYERKLLLFFVLHCKNGKKERFNSVFKNFTGSNMELYNMLEKMLDEGLIFIDNEYSYLRNESMPVDMISLRGIETHDGYLKLFNYYLKIAMFIVAAVAIPLTIVICTRTH